MNEQEKRERAIRVLEGNYKNFVLRHNRELVTVNEILNLLKAQEPRVMTLEEVKLASENAEPVCVETADGELRWALTYPGIEPPKEGFRYPGGVLFDAVDVNDEIYDGDFYGMTMPDGRPHDLGWRAWTSRPDHATREAAKWDE